MDRSSLFATAIAALAITTAGCSSGGGSPTPAPTPAPAPGPPPPPAGSPAIQVLPAAFDFGKVTPGNTPAPLEVTITNTNTGTAQLSVSSISLLAPTGSPFALTLNGGSRPCGSVSPTLPTAASCTVQVAFLPTTGGPTFASTLQINSNATNGSVVTLPITATSEMVTGWTLRINQIDVGACPAATAYVSVIDQAGFPVTSLDDPNFTVAQGTTSISGFTVSLAETTTPVAIAGVLDHSLSLTQQPVAFADMKSGFSTFFGGLRTGDEGAVINFDSVVELVQDWTPNTTLLQSVIAAPWDNGPDTKLYDAANRSVTETAKKTAFRRAAIIATDGADNGASITTLDMAISNAQTAKVPLFTVGIGSSINATVLNRMAAETGGLFFEASTSQNLATIYKQLSSILYGNQYVVKFDRGPGAPGTVTIGANSIPAGLSANDTRPIPACP